MMGVPGAGKSTQLRKIIGLGYDNHDPYDCCVFSLDTCRLEFMDEVIDYSNEKECYRKAFEYANEHKEEFSKFVEKKFAEALTHEYVFVDNTNLTKKSRKQWITGAKDAGYLLIGVHVDVALEVAIKRQETRTDKSVPADVVTSMYNSLQEFLVPSEVDEIIYM
jgi:tRNA uridine 5-carbamoylmethylation protein Kti12